LAGGMALENWYERSAVIKVKIGIFQVLVKLLPFKILRILCSVFLEKERTGKIRNARLRVPLD